MSYINTLSQQGTDVIVVSANDKDAICGALNEARQAGAKVVTYDSDTKPECRDLFINQATAEGIAASQIKLIADAVGPDGGEIAILSATANATNQNAWIEMMKTELAKPEYSKLKLVDTVYGDDDDQKSFTEAQGLLAKHPNLKGIISPTTVGVAAAARYLSGSTYKGKVQLTGSRHAEPDARLRQGRHGQGVRALEPGRPRLPRGVRRRLTRVRDHHRQGGRQVQGRQARRVHCRQGRHGAARRPVYLQLQQHRPVQLLTTGWPRGRSPSGRPRRSTREGVVRRVCFTLQVDPARLDEYRERHAAVWPEMLIALRDAGWHDYSLFLRDDGLLVGYLMTDDLEAAQAAMEATDVNRRWQAEMAPFFVELPGGRPDRGFTLLDEVFNLDAQLDRARQLGEDHD